MRWLPNFFYFEEVMRVTPSSSLVSLKGFSSPFKGDIAFFSGCPYGED